MAEFLESFIVLEVVLSTAVVLLLLALSFKFKTKLISKKTVDMVKKKKIIFYTAVFFGVVGMSLFIGTEILEAGDVFFMFVEESTLEQIEAIMLFLILSAQILILSLVLEARHIDS